MSRKTEPRPIVPSKKGGGDCPTCHGTGVTGMYQERCDTCDGIGSRAPQRMKILVACEYSGRVREAFRKLGHDAWSCDLLPADDNSPYHIQDDVLKHLDERWDMMIAHPPCTYLTNAGVMWLDRRPERWEQMNDGAEFFKTLLEAPIPLIAVENPIMHKYAIEIIGRRQDQVVQPWMFGHMERKGTCLWLKGLPELQPTHDVREAMLKLPKNRQQRLHYLPPSKDRWKLRSTTYQGIADAMGQQWGSASPALR